MSYLYRKPPGFIGKKLPEPTTPGLLSELYQSRLTTQLGHSEDINLISFSPDGRFLATGGEDRAVLVWDVASGREIQRFEYPTNITFVSFTPDSRFLLTGDARPYADEQIKQKEDLVRMWDVITGNELWRFETPGGLSCMSNSLDGRLILVGSRNGTVWIRDAKTGKEVRHFKAHKGDVRSIALSPDGHLILTSGYDEGGNKAVLRDLATLNEIYSFGPFENLLGIPIGFEHLAFTPDSRLIVMVTGGMVYSAELRDVATGTLLHKFDYYSVTSITFSKDGRLILIGTEKDGVRILDSVTLKEVRKLEGRYGVSSPNNQFIAAANGRFASLSDLSSGQEVIRFEGKSDDVRSVGFSSDGRFILIAAGLTASRWDTKGREIVQYFRGHKYTINSAAFSPDSKYVLTGSGDNSSRLWDATTGEELRSLKGQGPVAFSPDGRVFATGCGGICLWDTATGELIKHLQWDLRENERDSDSGVLVNINSIAFSPDNRFLLTTATGVFPNIHPPPASDRPPWKLWQISSEQQDGKTLRTLLRRVGMTRNRSYGTTHHNTAKAGAFAPDSKHFVIATGWGSEYGKTIELHKTSTSEVTDVTQSETAG